MWGNLFLPDIKKILNEYKKFWIAHQKFWQHLLIVYVILVAIIYANIFFKKQSYLIFNFFEKNYIENLIQQ